MIRRIGQIAIVVRDLDGAVAYYRDAVGLEFLFQVPRMAFFRCGEVRLMLALPEAGLDHLASILYFDTTDIRAEFDGMKSRGVTFVNEPHIVAPMTHADLWLAEFRDPEGNVMALMSEVPRAQPTAR